MKLKLYGEIVFPCLDQAVAKFGGEPKFSCCILVDKKSEDLVKFREIVDKLEKDSFDGQNLDVSKLCVSDGDDKDYANFKGKIVFTMANKKRPITIGKQKQAVVAGDDEFPVSGNKVYVIADIWPLTGQFGPRIVASLEAVQYVSVGKPYSKSNVDIDSDFDTIEDTKTADSLGL